MGYLEVDNVTVLHDVRLSLLAVLASRLDLRIRWFRRERLVVVVSANLGLDEALLEVTDDTAQTVAKRAAAFVQLGHGRRGEGQAWRMVRRARLTCG